MKGQIVVVLGVDQNIYLYTHSHGSTVIENAWHTLKRGDNWNNPAYMARMIFNRMTSGNPTGSTGYGIGISSFNTHAQVKVDCLNELVTIMHDIVMTFEEFTTMTGKEMKELQAKINAEFTEECKRMSV